MIYKHFEISDNISFQELKKQYRKLSMQHHPDKDGDKEVFYEINHEYWVALQQIKENANDPFICKLINEQIHIVGKYVDKLKIPKELKPAVSYLVRKGITELSKIIKQKLK